MPHKILRRAHPEYDPEYIERKIKLIEKGLPIDISEDELRTLEEVLRGARSFYIDILTILNDSNGKGNKQTEKNIVEEARNLLGVEMALRKVDVFRMHHHKNIKKV